MVLDNEFTGDLRVENEVQALQKSGFNVFVLCLNFGSKPELEDYHGAKIVRISQSKNKIKKLRALTNTVFNYYPAFWSKQIIKFVRKYKIHVLHIHDLYMFAAGFKAQDKLDFRIPIVGDLHENYVEGLRHYRFSTTFPGNLLISIPKWEQTEIEWIKKLDYAVTVIEEAVERYNSIGIERDKFTVVSNYINLEEFNKFEVDEDIITEHSNKFTISYIGAFDLHRGLESVVRSLPLIQDKVPEVELLLVGAGQNAESLKSLAEELGVGGIIKFEGWQQPSLLPSYIKSSNICIIPHLKTVHTDNTIPHKLFQYMYLERPVISSNCTPIERIVNECKCGLIYESNNSEDLAQKVISLYNDDELRNSMGENGNREVLQKYNWKSTAENLIKLYRKIQTNIGI